MPDRAVLLIRRRRPIGEPAGLVPGETSGYGVLDGSVGAGRVRLSLAELGVPIDRLVQAVIDPTPTPADVAAFDLRGRFDAVILGSHFVNNPDEQLRGALLDAARRHVTVEGDVLIEHHPIDWAETAAPTSPTPGADVGMEDVRVEGPLVHAVSTYDIGGRYERVPFTARVLSKAELDDALSGGGLRRRGRLSPTWLLAGPA